MVFLELRHDVLVSHHYNGELKERLVWPQGSPISIRVLRGSTALLSSHGRGTGPKVTLKGDSRGLSGVAVGNPGFPLLVMVTSGSFSGAYGKSGIQWSWEGPLGTPLVLVQWKRPHLELRWEPQGSSPVLTWVSG